MARYIEDWKPIVGYEGLYEISNTGQIRNAKGEIKKSQIKKDKHTNYREISLWRNGTHKRFLVHRLVAIAFIPNPNDYPIINHKDQNGMNNCVDNLEWCNHSYNNRYKRFPIKPRIYKTDKRLTKEHKSKISASMKKFRRENANLKFEYDGKMLSIPELAEVLNVEQETLRARYRRTGTPFLLCSYGEPKDKLTKIEHNSLCETETYLKGET